MTALCDARPIMILAQGPRSGLVLVAAVRLGIAERQSGAGLNVCACS